MGSPSNGQQNYGVSGSSHVDLVHVFHENQAGVDELHFSPTGDVLASFAKGDGIWLWNISDYARIGVIDLPAGGDMFQMAFSPDGKILAAAYADGVVRLWDLSGKLVAQLTGHTGAATGVQFTDDGRFMITADSIGRVRWWDYVGKRMLVHFLGDQAGGPTNLGGVVALPPESSDVYHLAVIGEDVNGQVQIWQVRPTETDADAQVRWVGAVIPPTHLAMSPCFSPDGHQLAVCQWGPERVPRGSVQLFDAVSLELLGELVHAEELPLDLCFSPIGRYLATAGAVGTVWIWESVSRSLLTSFGAHVGGWDYRAGDQEWAVGAIDWAPKGNLIATSGMSVCSAEVDDTTNDAEHYPIKLWRPEIARSHGRYRDERSTF